MTTVQEKAAGLMAGVKARAAAMVDRAQFWKRKPAAVSDDVVMPDERPLHPKDDWVLKLIDNAVTFSTWGCLSFLTLYCLKFVGRVKLNVAIDWSNSQPFQVIYDLSTSLDLLPLAALAFVSIGIVCFAKAWVTLFAEEPFSNWVTKWGSFLLGVSTSVVIIMGSMTVNQDVRQEDYRASMVTEEKVANTKAGEQARIDLKKDELARMQAKPSYQGLAASAGVESWSKKIAMTPETDPNFKQISRAITDAEAADKLKGEIEEMTVALAQGTTSAEVKADVGAEMHDGVTTMVRQSVVWRMPLMAAVMDVILIFGPFMAKNRRRRMLAAWSSWMPGITVGMPRMRASDLEYPWENFAPFPGFGPQPAAAPAGATVPPPPPPAPDPAAATPPPSPDPAPTPDPAPPPSPKSGRTRQRALPAPTPDECAQIGIVWMPEDAGTPPGGAPDKPIGDNPSTTGDRDDKPAANGTDQPAPDNGPDAAATQAAGDHDGGQTPTGMDDGGHDQGGGGPDGDPSRGMDTGGDPDVSDLDIPAPGATAGDDGQFTWDTPPDPDDSRMDDDGAPPRRQAVGA